MLRYHIYVFAKLCKLLQEMGKKVECLGDLQGPKFRVGELAGRSPFPPPPPPSLPSTPPSTPSQMALGGDPVELKNGDVLEFGPLNAIQVA